MSKPRSIDRFGGDVNGVAPLARFNNTPARFGFSHCQKLIGAPFTASGRSDNRRLQEALRIATNYLELAPTPPAIGSRELEVLQAWMATPGRADQ